MLSGENVRVLQTLESRNERRVSLCTDGVRIFWSAVQGQATSESDGSGEAVMALNLNKADWNEANLCGENVRVSQPLRIRNGCADEMVAACETRATILRN